MPQHPLIRAALCWMALAGAFVLAGSGAATAATLAGDRDNGCVIAPDAEVYCWGDTQWGAAGLGPNSWLGTPPTRIEGLRGARAIAVGLYLHACALMPDGSVKCWGDNGYARIGTGTNPANCFNGACGVPTPTTVAGLAGATDLVAGISHTCALAGGSAWCWGDNVHGNQALGYWEPLWERGGVPVATRIPGTEGATAIGASGYTTCVIIAGGRVRCWGWGRAGQLGNGQSGERPNAPNGYTDRPQDVVGIADARALNRNDVGTTMCAAVGDAGAVFCWGSGWNGALGNGVIAQTATNVAATPVGPIAGLPAARALAHRCAIAAGAPWCWGVDLADDGKTPLADDIPQAAPLDYAQGAAAVEISTLGFGRGACIRNAANEVWCQDAVQGTATPWPSDTLRCKSGISSMPCTDDGTPDDVPSGATCNRDAMTQREWQICDSNQRRARAIDACQVAAQRLPPSRRAPSRARCTAEANAAHRLRVATVNCQSTARGKRRAACLARARTAHRRAVARAACQVKPAAQRPACRSRAARLR